VLWRVTRTLQLGRESLEVRELRPVPGALWKKSPKKNKKINICFKKKEIQGQQQQFFQDHKKYVNFCLLLTHCR
jgi:hypothetical protein